MLLIFQIIQFLNARYVCAPEATWRFFQYKKQEQSHIIERLAVHIPFKQPVNFQPGSEEVALFKADQCDTTLTPWFKLNQTGNSAQAFLYHDIPNCYTFVSKKWKKMKSIE
jgi:hypothetical protein